MPGQHHTPIRIGRDAHPLLSLGSEQGDGAEAQAAAGIARQTVTGVAASKFFSVLRTAAGEVWTCGGKPQCFRIKCRAVNQLQL